MLDPADMASTRCETGARVSEDDVYVFFLADSVFDTRDAKDKRGALPIPRALQVVPRWFLVGLLLDPSASPSRKEKGSKEEIVN